MHTFWLRTCIAHVRRSVCYIDLSKQGSRVLLRARIKPEPGVEVGPPYAFACINRPELLRPEELEESEDVMVPK